MEQYKVGIAGIGRIAALFEEDVLREKPASHAGAYSLNPRTRIVAGACRTDITAEKFMEKWKANIVYYDFNDMLINEELDIVSICLPSSLHYSAVMAALNNASVKAIFCEKPLAENLNDARVMVRSCEKRGVKLIVNHTRRWEAPYGYARRVVNTGELGDLLSINMAYTSGLFVMGTHIVDTARFMAGNIDFVVGYEEPVKDLGTKPSENWRIDDPSISGFLHFTNGARGFLNGSALKKYLHVGFDLHFTNGRLLISNNGRNTEVYKPTESKFYQGYNELEPAENLVIEGVNPLKKAVDEIVECLDENKESISSGREALKTLEVLVALSESAKNGSRKIEL